MSFTPFMQKDECSGFSAATNFSRRRLPETAALRVHGRCAFRLEAPARRIGEPGSADAPRKRHLRAAPTELGTPKSR
jgi:hypothetical protein